MSLKLLHTLSELWYKKLLSLEQNHFMKKVRSIQFLVFPGLVEYSKLKLNILATVVKGFFETSKE